MPLVANSICRFTVNQVFNGRPVANIVDMQVDTTGGPVSRDEALFLAAGDIINNWCDHFLPVQSTQVIFQSVSWVDLNSEDGATGIRSVTSNNTLPRNGTASGGPAQGNIAYRLNKTGTARRGQRSGRMYICGVNEDANVASNGNAVSGAWQGYLNVAGRNFLEGINDVEGPVTDVTRKMVVLHVVNDVYQGYSDVSALICDPIFGSQRRRLRG